MHLPTLNYFIICLDAINVSFGFYSSLFPLKTSHLHSYQHGQLTLLWICSTCSHAFLFPLAFLSFWRKLFLFNFKYHHEIHHEYQGSCPMPLLPKRLSIFTQLLYVRHFLILLCVIFCSNHYFFWGGEYIFASFFFYCDINLLCSYNVADSMSPSTIIVRLSISLSMYTSALYIGEP